jgi:hypothetical protein
MQVSADPQVDEATLRCLLSGGDDVDGLLPKLLLLQEAARTNLFLRPLWEHNLVDAIREAFAAAKNAASKDQTALAKNHESRCMLSNSLPVGFFQLLRPLRGLTTGTVPGVCDLNFSGQLGILNLSKLAFINIIRSRSFFYPRGFLAHVYRWLCNCAFVFVPLSEPRSTTVSSVCGPAAGALCRQWKRKGKEPASAATCEEIVREFAAGDQYTTCSSDDEEATRDGGELKTMEGQQTRW